MVIRAKQQLQRQAGKGEQGQGRNYTPEHLETPEVARLSQELSSRRRDFEQSSGGPVRLGGDLAREYAKRGWSDIEQEHGAAGPSMQDYDRLATSGHSPFPQPTRWEDLSDDERQRSIAGLEAHGSSWEKLTNDMGQGLDRAYSRSSEMGQIPFASNFYEPEGFARQILGRTMGNAPPEHQVAAISMTSPKNKFIQITDDGRVQMPNVNAAYAAGKLGISGDTHLNDAQFRKLSKQSAGDPEWEHAKSIGAEVSGGGIGMPANIAKAAWGLHQGSEEGGSKPISEWMGLSSKTHPEGTPIFGASPKVGPFAGSFLDESPPFHVTDVHMGAIALPHLSGVKASGQNINPSGAPTGDKTEREVAIERIPHAHALIDHAMRTAMGERGLEKIRFQQGAGWGEEQIRRSIDPDPGARRMSFRPDVVYQWQAESMPHTALNFQKRSKQGVGSLYLPS